MCYLIFVESWSWLAHFPPRLQAAYSTSRRTTRNTPAVACQQVHSHWQAPLPVRAVQNLKHPGLHATWSQDQEFRVNLRARGIQVTRKARWARRSPRRMSNTSRQVTRASRAETSVHSAEQGEGKHQCVYACSAVVKLVVSMHEISGSNPVVIHVFSKTFCTGIYGNMQVYTLLKSHVQVYTSIHLLLYVRVYV